ncbi:MAG: glutaredoxin 3 [Rhodobacteraceae bacterium]|nr:glutaredoxin 3 [Paracoccaceae bacterium]
MKPVEIYTTPICGYCTAAKRLLSNKGVEFTEYNVMTSPEKRTEMTQRSNGGRTVPQIFIDGKAIGGCDELFGLEGDNVLDKMLA